MNAAAHWLEVHTTVLPERIEAMRAARTAVAEAVLNAEDATAAYGRYVAAHAVWQATHNAVAHGLRTFVNDVTGEPHPDPDERWGRAVFPEGVQPPDHNAPEPFLVMFETAAKAAREAHRATAVAELYTALAADLEPAGA